MVVRCGCKVRAYLKARFRCLVPVLGGGAKRISKVKVLGSCAVRVLSKQAKVKCLVLCCVRC